MPYIGNLPAEKYASYDVQHITTSATSSYVLDKNVANENEIRVVLNNIIQQPGSSYAYTASGNTLTLSAATTSSDTLYVVFTGKAVQTVTPPPSSVGLAQFNATGSPGTNTFLRGDNSWATPSDTVSYLVKISADDTTPDFLNGKLVAGSGISLTEGSGGGDETLTVANTATTRPNVNPLIINGDMNIAQRATSATGITDDGYKLCDRWYEYLSSLGTYTFTQEGQSINDPVGAAGFRQAFRIDCTTADASPSAGDEFWWGIKFEGQNLQLIKKGSSNAEKLTLAFWVKSNKTGVGQVNFRDTDNGRMCSGTYTISVANTWEHKIINIAADTTGAFTDDNAESLQIQWYLDSGSNYEGGATPTAWEADSAGDRNASGTLNIGDNTANDWSITGIQLEVGEYTSSTIPPFQFESFGDNLSRCKRYYQEMNRPSYGGNTMLTGITTNNNQMFMMRLPVSMRSAPTISMTGTTITIYSSNSSSNVSSANPTLTPGTFGTDGGRLLYPKIGDNGHGAWIDIDNDNTSMNFAAEL